jgi:hypothetical protein
LTRHLESLSGAPGWLGAMGIRDGVTELGGGAGRKATKLTSGVMRQ